MVLVVLMSDSKWTKSLARIYGGVTKKHKFNEEFGNCRSVRGIMNSGFVCDHRCWMLERNGSFGILRVPAKKRRFLL